MLQRFCIWIIYKFGIKVPKYVLIALIAAIPVYVFAKSTMYDLVYQKISNPPQDRHAALVKSDPMGDEYKSIAYLKQNWSEADSLWFYTTTQGSDLLPYDFFLAVEQHDNAKPFRDNENMNRYRYMPQEPSSTNPDGLPVGMVADTYLGKKYMGFTCAACHCSQLNFNKVGIRIDGGPSAADMDLFMNDLATALDTTQKDPAKKARFISAVLAKGNYKDADKISADLEIYTLRLQTYNIINKSDAEYGYYRLDAFGRIYNRVLEYVVNREALTPVLGKYITNPDISAAIDKLSVVPDEKERDLLLLAIQKNVPPDSWKEIKQAIFINANAPVSYPFIWDVPQSDYVQWNGLAPNADLGPIGRNAGEVIGVFATLDWSQKPGFSISSIIGGQGFGNEHINFQSSVNVHNLRKLENRLATLHSPSWEEAAERKLLPGIDPDKASRGATLFGSYCANCHPNIKPTSEDRRVIAHIDKLDVIGTDEQMAKNSVHYTGYSGILRNQYAKSGVGGILLDVKAPVASILTSATENVIATPDPDKWFFTRGAEWASDLIGEAFTNKIKPSVKVGNYNPDSTAAPYNSLLSYKGRSLNGIWATAPYLHNGSVPTLYDLLLPEKDRPKEFMVGSREFDPKKVGFKSEGYSGFKFVVGANPNKNSGHEYGTICGDPKLPCLTDDQRWEIVEYLKSL